MKAKVLRCCNALLALVMGMLGFSCTSHMRVEYGTPSAQFVIEGKVVNEEDEPLEKIEIVHRGGWKDGTGVMHWDSPYTLYTNSEGVFYGRYGDEFPMSYYMVVANDKSGVYESDTINPSVSYSGGDGHWYYGTGRLRVDFVLKKKDNVEK